MAVALAVACAAVLGAHTAICARALPAPAGEAAEASESRVRDILLALKSDYPDGTPWSNEREYESRALGQIGRGCHAFALILSDAAFGDSPGALYRNPAAARAGDILRIDHDTHSVVVLEVGPAGVVVAEGNFAGVVRWGRTISFEELSEGFRYGITRYADASAPASAAGYLGFADVREDDWYVRDGLFGYAIAHGLMRGYGASGLFGPYDPVTRGQAAVILFRMAGEPPASAEPFADVDYAAYYGPAITWARASGVAGGYLAADGTRTSFGPYDPVTREQLAVMFHNFAQKVAGIPGAPDAADASGMPGWDEVSPWARTAVSWAVGCGLLGGGDPDGAEADLDPQGIARRAGAATMAAALHRMLP